MLDPEALDTDKIDEVALALLYFSRHSDGYGTRAWKGIAWSITDRLHEKGWISDPKGKSKSVSLTKEGERLCEEFARKHFARREG